MKRFLAFALTIVMLVGILTVDVFADDSGDYIDMTTSQAMIDIIKDYEGFSAYPYRDNSQWTVGYGTCCGVKQDGSDIPPDILDGITPEEGEAMLKEYLAVSAEPSVNELFRQMGRQPSQQQFDAILDFTYNFGSYWWYGEDTMVEAYLENPTTDLDLVRVLGAWCRSGGEVTPSLCSRRIREAIVYLYGEYSIPYGNIESDLPVIQNSSLPYFSYVLYDGDGIGISPSGYTDTVEYFADGTKYGALLNPSVSGYTLAGWYRDDGTQLTASDTVWGNEFVTAKWSNLPFVDVPGDAWYAPAVIYCYENGIMNGYGTASRFEPYMKASRGMIVTVLYRMAGSPVVSSTSSFSDVGTGIYYSDAVAWAVQNGITTGYKDGTFRPDDDVTRAEMVTFLYRYAEKIVGLDVSCTGDLSVYPDAASIPPYARAPFAWSTEVSMINGTADGLLMPNGQATRAMLAKVLMMLDQLS